MNGPKILDGRRLASQLLPTQIARVERIARRRGRPPRAHLIGFEAAGEGPDFIVRKIVACDRAGVLATTEMLPLDATTDDVLAALAATSAKADGVFLEFPFPEGVDGAFVAESIPPALDVDTMTSERIAAFRTGAGAPPVTVSAALALLDADRVSIDGLRGVVVAERSPFAEMFAEALEERGASLELVPPEQAARARRAQLVVVAAAQPGLVRAADLAPGAVVIDVGYYNPGGRGDVDTTGGIEHLRAIAPVPGGIGPSTIAMLVDRVIDFAEAKG